MTGSDYAAALRPRSRAPRVVRTLAVCAAWAWFAYCVTDAVRSVADAYAAAACAAAGQSWGGVTRSCDSPPIELHIAPDPPKHDPLHGPGGA